MELFVQLAAARTAPRSKVFDAADVDAARVECAEYFLVLIPAFCRVVLTHREMVDEETRE